MKYLLKKYWHKFRGIHGRFDGIFFEDLVMQILKAEYPKENWIRTKKTWDKKRDFFSEFKIDGKTVQKWAECKSYKDNLSINVLAPTLIMSTLNNVNEILFFSYSPLNKQAKESLSMFSGVHKKVIRVFDDEKLEALIFKHKHNIEFSFFFPNYIDKELNTESKNYRVYETVFLPRHNYEYRLQELRSQKLKVNEIIIINIYIENFSIEKKIIQISVNLKNDDGYRYFESANRQLQINKTIVLDGATLFSYQIPLKIITYAATIYLPEITIQCEHQKNSLFGSFQCSWLLDTPFIGYQNLLDEVDSRFASKTYSVVTLHGCSGVGKTRLAQEIHNRYLLKNEKCIVINTEQNNGICRNWLMKVMARLYTLPFVNMEALTLKENLETPDNIAMMILYNQDFEIEKNIHRVALSLLEAQSEHRYLLVFDNVQNLDDLSIKILHEMMNLYEAYHDVNLLLTFNMDYLIKDSLARNFFSRIMNLRKDYKDNFLLQQINGFTTQQANSYVKQCFGVSTDTCNLSAIAYDAAINRIVAIAQNRPLFLEQILLKLCEDSIIKNIDDYFYIVNNERFYESLEKLPYQLNEYFELRWQFAKKQTEKQFSAMKSIIQLLCFFESISREILDEMDFDELALDALFSLGFIRQNEKIVFYHQLIGKFFSNKFPYLNAALLRDCLVVLKKANRRNIYPAQYFIAAAQSGHLDQGKIAWAVEQLLKNKIPGQIQKKFNDELYSAIADQDMFQRLNAVDIVGFYGAYCYHLQAKVSYLAAIEKYELIYKRYLLEHSFFYTAGDEYMLFIKEYLNMLLVLHRNDQVIVLAKEVLELVSKLRFKYRNGAKRAQAILLNRQHIAYNRTDIPDNLHPFSALAKEGIDKSYQIAQAIHDIELIIQNLIDYGYLYYCSNKYNDKTIYYWEKAYLLWDKNRKNVPAWESGVYYHKALAATMQHNYAQAYELIRNVEIFHKRNLYVPYFYTKSKILKAVVSLMTGKPFDEVLHLTNEAENLCQENNSPGGFAVCSYIRAKAYELLSEEKKTACRFYQKALTQFIRKSENDKEEERATIYFLDISSALRSMGDEVDEETINMVKSSPLRKKINEIKKMRCKDWKTYLSNRSAESPLCNQKKTINYPCP
ncbi:AAA family ATPase [Desulfoscipio sp. XC116]|uniref:ATP-binding protein n=1 Tax=Desulfoscipio sp. XC116 TaxID=3144975 RepID=UPI00325B036A